MGTDFVEVVSGFITKYNLTITSLLPALAMMHDVLDTFEQVTKESSSTPLALPGPLKEEPPTAAPSTTCCARLTVMMILGINHLLYQYFVLKIPM